MTRHRRIVPCLLLSMAPFTAAPPPAAGQAAELPPAVVEALREADDLMYEENPKEAIKAFKQADKLAGGSCFDCQLGLARAFNQVGAYKEGLKSAEAALRLASGDDKLALAYHEQGKALFAMAGGDAEMLGRAEQAFRQVLEKTQGKVNTARYNLAGPLLRLGRDAEAVALLEEYVEREPNGPYAESARELIANPLRARKRLIPDFALVTLDGDYLTAEELRGKVVLFDFWATWCAPCLQAIPELRVLARRRAGDPFVLVSVSADHDEPTLRAFLREHAITWPQVWDERHEFTNQCQVKSFPTYILVDHTGEIIFSASGWGPGIERDLQRKIFSAVRAARKSATTAAATPP
jgi:thioredoxin-like negative regulator of GroEL